MILRADKLITKPLLLELIIQDIALGPCCIQAVNDLENVCFIGCLLAVWVASNCFLEPMEFAMMLSPLWLICGWCSRCWYDTTAAVMLLLLLMPLIWFCRHCCSCCCCHWYDTTVAAAAAAAATAVATVMIPLLLPLLLLSLSLLLLPLLPPSLPLLPLGNRYCCSQQEGGNTTPLKVRTVSQLAPQYRWNAGIATPH